MREPRRTIRNLLGHPVFREEIRRPGRRAAALLLPAASTLLVAAWLLARCLEGGAAAPEGGGARLQAGFDSRPWLGAGLLLLLLCTHAAVPPLLARVALPAYDLRTLNFLVRGGHPAAEVLRAQAAAALLPPLLGLLPFGLALPLVALFEPARLLPVAGAVGAALLWSLLSAAVSLWCGARGPSPGAAVARAYLITTLLLPLLAAVAAGMGLGCSIGRPNPAPTFAAGAGLTWGLLVFGVAATCWDLALARLMPEGRPPLWRAADEGISLPGAAEG